MNTRLQQFIKAENLSQSQFADAIGVARASVSHILAGRNKPGFDFIESMSRHFPALNLEWLITGKGRMYKDSMSAALRQDATVEMPLETKTPDSEIYEEDDLFSPANALRNRMETAPDNQNPAQTKFGSQTAFVSPAASPAAVQSPAAVFPPATSFDQRSQGAAAASPAPLSDDVTGLFSSKRSISKIIVFYDDNSFQELK